MDEESKINYYAIIPATVRYDSRLKPAEKLLYGEITALANKNGYCFAQNKYFADLYNVTIGTVSKWFSHLQQLGYIVIELIRNNKKEIISRHIYLCDTPMVKNNHTPYSQKRPYPMVKNDIDNNININIDDLFNLINNNSPEIPEEFYNLLESLELIYTPKIFMYMQDNGILKLKNIIYTLYQIYNSNLSYLLSKIDRETLIKIYSLSEENSPNNIQSYFKKAVINKYF